jgi:[protein-PII] uridylyltransferase
MDGMASPFDSLPTRRAIIDRRVVADRLAAISDGDSLTLRREATAILREVLGSGRGEIARRLAEHPSRGHETAASYAFLTDQILRLAFDLTTERLLPPGDRAPSSDPAGERIVLVAVGGYGRAEMALFSDVDVGFLTPARQTARAEKVIETILHILWDLGLKVGHSSRSLDEMVRMAKSDLTIRTALLEGRYVWGDEALYDEAKRRFEDEVVAGTARTFVVEKLAERDERHRRMGDSRYVVEPNLKEGKGGLRDLHTLFWIGKYMLNVRSVPELVDAGLLTPAELKQFQRAENFLWAVRCHLHVLTGRAEERLTFDVQRDIATAMRYNDRPGRSAVERFMQHYFLTAKNVGALTGVFLAHLDESFAKRGGRFGLPAIGPGFGKALGARVRRPRKLDGFVIDRGRLAAPSDDFFAADPVRLIELFTLADRHGLEIHPLTMRQATRDDGMIDGKVRASERANALFLELLTSPRTPATVLRWMNEAGVFGRFVPDFGRVVAQMQFDMYHHFTVDEHTIHAIGLLSQIEHGVFAQEHALADDLIGKIVVRRVLYVAVLLHDIAKGRGGDHSILGAEVAQKLCPRFGLTPAETEMVAWLVRQHLLMSATAFKRDLSDFKTILDFSEQVQSPERLRLLYLLTVVDIRAVGPGVWNGWKRQLLADLYHGAEEVLRLGHKQRGRQERVADKQARLREALGWETARFDAFVQRMPESYWVAEGVDILENNARAIAEADISNEHLSITTRSDAERGATLVSVYAADHPGLFYRIAGAIHVAGGNIIDARIHTTRDGMAVDNFLVQDPFGGSFDDEAQITRLRIAIADSLANRNRVPDRLASRKPAHARAAAFDIEPVVLIDSKASNRYTVIEVNARDRPALLNGLANALFKSQVTIHSAHIATYGERAVDTFYLTDLTGDKITSATRLRTLERRLLVAAGGTPASEAA